MIPKPILQEHLLKDLREAMLNLDKTDWKQAGFNMWYWAKNKMPESPELGCGTVCCAYGVGTTLPSWKQVSLRLVPRETDTLEMLFSCPTVEAQEKLGLSGTQFNHIFALLTYGKEAESITPMDVVSHIDNVLNGTIK